MRRSSRTSARSIPTSANCSAGSARKQVRASGTVGGNVANGSPIGDTPPALIALDATLELRKGKQVRTHADRGVLHRLRQAGPRAGRTGHRPSSSRSSTPAHIFRCYKVSKRFDQDISSVMGAFRFTVDEDGTISEARIAYRRHGGDAEAGDAAPKTALTGSALRDSRAWARAFAALREDFAPIDDHRASAPLPHRDGARPARQGADRGGGHRAATRTRIVGQRESRPDDGRSPTSDRRQRQPLRRRARSRSPTTARSSTSPATRSISTTSASRPARCISRPAMRRSPPAGSPRLDLEPVQAAPGVVAVLTAADIPGKNDISPKEHRRRSGDPPRARSCSTARCCSWWSPRPATRRAAPPGSPASRPRRRCR